MRYTPFALLLLVASALAQTNPAAPASTSGNVTTTFQTVTLISPNKKLAITFDTVTPKLIPAAEGRLIYSVTFDGKPVLEKSGLRLDLRGQQSLGTNMQIVSVTNWTVDESYRVVAGK